MENFQFDYPAGLPAQGRALVGVVSSGDLEILVEPGQAGHTRLTVNTSVDGREPLWRKLFDRIFPVSIEAAAMDMEINDFGATPGVVRMRLAQAFELLAPHATK